MKTQHPLAAGQHQQALLLLPWYLNKRLQTDEHQQVEKHLRSCLICRRELAVLEQLSSAVKQASEWEAAAEVSFAGLKSKLPAQRWAVAKSNDLPGLPAGNRIQPNLYGRIKTACQGYLARPHGVYPYWAMAVALFLAVIPLVFHWQRASISTDYYTLSSAKPESVSGEKLRVVFVKPLQKTRMEALLSHIQGQLIGEPNSVGAYTVKLLGAEAGATSINTAVDFLRAQPEVMLAEPVLEP